MALLILADVTPRSYSLLFQLSTRCLCHPRLKDGFHFAAAAGVAVVDGRQNPVGAHELTERLQLRVAAVLAVGYA